MLGIVIFFTVPLTTLTLKEHYVKSAIDTHRIDDANVSKIELDFYRLFAEKLIMTVGGPI